MSNNKLSSVDGKKENIRKITVIGIMSAVSAVLMMLSFNIPIMPAFIKMDFSELPALITSFSIGPISGVIVCFIKNLINLPLSTSYGVGELSNFFLGVCLVLPAGLIYKKIKNIKGALIGALCGSLIMAVISIPWNYYVTYPAFVKVYGMSMEAILRTYQNINPNVNGLFQALLIFNLPYTFCKGIVISILTFLVYKKFSPIIKGKKEIKNDKNEKNT